MSNFLDVARDLHEARPSDHTGFLQVFDHIRGLHAIKQFMSFDLENIEQILSLLEMGSALGHNALPTEVYTDFLKSVIAATTPDFTLARESIEEAAAGVVWKIARRANLDTYLKFAVWFLGRDVQFGVRAGRPTATFSAAPVVNYQVSFVTLNYDMVLENMVTALTENSDFKVTLRKKPADTIAKPASDELFIAKLHGSLDGPIVPPTWNKTQRPEIQQAWALAQELLARAHEIRFVGYSLPESDAYVKYLLAVAVQQNTNLKRISIVNKDATAVDRFVSLFKPYKGRILHYGGETGDAMSNLPITDSHLKTANDREKSFLEIRPQPIADLPLRKEFT